jgi:hypothetical protein
VAKSGEKPGNKNKEGVAERAARFMRNINVLGAVACAGAAVIVPPAALVFNTLAAVNAAQAGGYEVARSWAGKNRLKRSKS